MPKTLILIPSRLSATRLPKKPLLKINDISLINHVYRKALETKIGEVFVVTGDTIIFDEVVKNGGKAILTFKNHVSGTDRIFEGLNNLKNYDYDYVMNWQGDEPLLDVNDIRKLNKKTLTNNAEISTLACKINSNKTFFDKNIVKVETENPANFYQFTKANKFFRRSAYINVAKTFQHIGVYMYKLKILKKFVSLKNSKNEKNLKLEQIRALENSIKIKVILANKKPVGVDTFEDFLKVKNILETKEF